MAITWASFTFLSVAQRTVLQSFADLAPQIRAHKQKRGSPPPVPTATFAQAKAAKTGLADMAELFSATALAIGYTLAYYRKQNADQAAQAFEDANP